MSVWPLPRVTFRELSSIEERRPVALLTDENVWAVLSGALTLPIVIQAEPAQYDRNLFTYLAENLPSNVEALYVVGEGAPVQAGKVIASANNIPLVIIPTALDTDVMLTPTAFMEDRSGEQPRLVMMETGPAADVIIDWGVIETAPDHLRGAALVDVVAIVTGLLDWRLAARKGRNAAGQRFEPWAAGVAASLAQQAIKIAGAVGQGQYEALDTLLDLMMMAVQLSNQLGHTRVRQGSEHDLARVLAGQVSAPLAHSEMVGPSLLFIAAMHGQDPAALRDALEAAGIRLDQLRPADMRLAIDQLSLYLDAYQFPYSILHEIEPDSARVVKALEAAGLAIREETWEVPGDTQPAPAQPPADDRDVDEASPDTAAASAHVSGEGDGQNAGEPAPDAGAEAPPPVEQEAVPSVEAQAVSADTSDSASDDDPTPDAADTGDDGDGEPGDVDSADDDPRSTGSSPEATNP